MSVWDNPYISKRGKYSDSVTTGITQHGTSGSFAVKVSIALDLGVPPPKKKIVGPTNKKVGPGPVRHIVADGKELK